jgi:carbamoyl-phosphate synthase large subunit
VYYTTTLAGGEAICESFAAGDEIKVRRLQDVHQGLV